MMRPLVSFPFSPFSMSYEPLPTQDSNETILPTDIENDIEELEPLISKSSNMATLTHYTNLLLGLGLLSLPYAFSRLGWILALTSCTLFCMVASWTCTLIAKHPSLSCMGERAFG